MNGPKQHKAGKKADESHEHNKNVLPFIYNL